jgi:hypothetical protein
MANEEIPENLDLRFLAAQNVRILRELGEMRGQMTDMGGQITDMRGQITNVQTQQIPQIRADIAELQVEFAAMRVDQGRAGKLLEEIHETQRNHGARLNVIDGRLAIIEKHTGLVQA